MTPALHSLGASHDARTCAGVPVVVQLNPTDARGHRCLVTVSDSDDPRRTFNRPATAREEAALSAALGLLRFGFRHVFGLVVQTCVAGNNAHTLAHRPGNNPSKAGGSGCGAGAGAGGDASEYDTLVVGSDPAEPSLIHGHVILRGPPGREPVAPGVRLESPAPGLEFRLKGPKLPYEAPKHQDAVVHALRKSLGEEAVRDAAASVFGLTVEIATL